jgi:transposase
MTSIGIDMSKRNFHASFDDATVRAFPNTTSGIDAFMGAMNGQGMISADATIGVEATGAYHLHFCTRLTQAGWRVVVINPLESYRFLTSQSLRKVKTDRRDAVAVRRMVLLGRGYPYTDTEAIIALKALIVEREGLVAMRAMMKQRREAHAAKQEAVGETLHDSATPVIAALTREIRAIERQFERYAPETQVLLRSIPGIGLFSAAALVAFVGDINRFASPEKLVAYIGLDCRVFESGTSVKGKGYISKRGNACLRRTLWNAAFIARQRNPDLQAYFRKKIARCCHMRRMHGLISLLPRSVMRCRLQDTSTSQHLYVRWKTSGLTSKRSKKRAKGCSTNSSRQPLNDWCTQTIPGIQGIGLAVAGPNTDALGSGPSRLGAA